MFYRFWSIMLLFALLCCSACVALTDDTEQKCNSIPCGISSLIAMVWLTTGNSLADNVESMAAAANPEMSMLDVRTLGKSLGVDLTAVKCSVQELEEYSSPAIVRVDGNHFLTIDCITKSSVRIVDHLERPSIITRDEFEHRFDGYALVPTSALDKSVEQVRVWSDGSVVDLGRVGEGTVLAQKYTIHTNSTAPLTIKNTKACCGSYVDTAGKNTVKLNEPLTVVHHLSCPDVPGEFSRAATVTFDSHYCPVVNLTVKGLVFGKPTVMPTGIDYGKVKRGSSAEVPLLINYVTPENKKSIRIASSSDSLSAKVTGYDPDKGILNLAIRLDSSNLRDSIRESLTIGFGESTAGSEINIPVSADVKGIVSVKPAQLMFGLVRTGLAATSSVHLVPNDNAAFSIRDIKAPAGIKVTWTKTEEQYVLTAQIESGSECKNIDDVIVVTTDAADDPEIRIPVYLMCDKTGLSATK